MGAIVIMTVFRLALYILLPSVICYIKITLIPLIVITIITYSEFPYSSTESDAEDKYEDDFFDDENKKGEKMEQSIICYIGNMNKYVT